MAYNKDATLQPVSIPELKPFMPSAHWYVTKLSTPYREYQQVSLLICVRQGNGKLDIRTYVSPTFSKGSKKFLALFSGIKTTSTDQRTNLVIGVAKALALITYKGGVREPKFNGSSATAQLWHGDLNWRKISIYFDKKGQALMISVNASDDGASAEK